MLLAALLAVGADGPGTTAVPLVIAAAALAVAAWAVQRGRAERAAHEAWLRAEAMRQATLAERLRIAQDLHDIVSHGLGLITVRAMAVRRTAGEDGGQAAQALADIEAVSRSMTRDLRGMLTVLRQGNDPPVPLHPVEGLDVLPEIVRSYADAGLRPRLALEPLCDVPMEMQIAVCRVVREALGNTARHAGPSGVDVRVYRDDGTLVVDVTDTGPDGPWTAAPGAGLGLLGLQERVIALGGSLVAGAADGGFRVLARLPAEVSP